MDGWEGYFHTGGNCYNINYNLTDNSAKVRKQDYTGEIITVFEGTYKECKDYIQELYEKNADYDLNL